MVILLLTTSLSGNGIVQNVHAEDQQKEARVTNLSTDKDMLWSGEMQKILNDSITDDHTSPTFVSITTPYTEIKQGMPLTYHIEAFDDLSGIHEVSMMLVTPSGKRINTANFYYGNDSKYNKFDLTFTADPFTADPLNELGTYKIDMIKIYDSKNNLKLISNTEFSGNHEDTDRYQYIDFSDLDVTITPDSDINKPVSNVNIINDTKRLENKTFFGDVYIGSNAVVTLQNCTVNGNVYVMGVLYSSITINNGTLFANQISYEDNPALNKGTVVLRGSNQIPSSVISDHPIKNIPLDLYTSKISHDGYLNLSGALLPDNTYTLNGEPLEYDYKGRFYLNDYYVGDRDSVTLKWHLPYGYSIEKEITLHHEQPVKLEISKLPNKLIYDYGDTISLEGIELIATYEDGTTKSVTNPIISGDLNQLGKQEITLEYHGATTTFSVDVKEVFAEAIELDTPTMEMTVNDNFQLNTTFYPSNTANKKITWRSDNPLIATVDNNGLVRAKSEGTTTIYAKTSNGLEAQCEVSVYPELVSIDIINQDNSGSHDIILDESASFTVKFNPDTALTQQITWSIDDEEIAIVDENGTVTAKNIGSTYLNAITEKGIEQSYLLNVIYPEPTSFYLDSAKILDINTTEQMTPYFEPYNATSDITWRIGNPDIASVDNDGNVTALNIGSTWLYATTTNGLEAKCLIYVRYPGGVDYLYFADDNTSVGIGYTSYVHVNCSGPYDLVYKKKWRTGNPKIATVDSNGYITGHSPGNTYLYVTTPDGREAKCLIKVIDPYAAKIISIRYTSKTIKIGEPFQFPLTTDLSNFNDSVQWHTGNPSIANVDSCGTVYPLSIGNTYLYATLPNGTKAKCLIKVIDGDNATDISLDYTNKEILTNENFQFTAKTEPDYMSNYIEWRTGNPSIAVVDDHGYVTPVSVGNTYLYATLPNGLEAKCLIKVLSDTDPNNLSIRYTSKTIKLYDQFQFIATTKPESASFDVTWRTGNQTIATVSKYGLVTAKSVGNTYLYATLPNGLEVKCLIKITDPNAPTLSIRYTSKTIKMNETFQFIATTKPESEANNVTWRTGNPAVATVDEYGNVTPVSVGNTYLYATLPNGLEVKCLVKIV